MKMVLSTTAKVWRLIAVCLGLICVCGVQSRASEPAATPPAQTAAQPALPVAASPIGQAAAWVAALNGPWRFHIGDEPGWADPVFDDSSWQTVTLGTALSEQGVDTYSGYAWYRLRLTRGQLTELRSETGSQAGNGSLEMLISGDSIGQLAVYENGVETGHTKGMTENPRLYQSPPLLVVLSSPASDGSMTVAIRSWARAEIHYGLLGKVEIGNPQAIADKVELSTARLWNRNVIAGLLASFLFLCVAVLGATLYIAQRNHDEYLWLSLLCVTVTLRGVTESAYALALISLPVMTNLGAWSSWLFVVTTLQFVLLFTGNRYRKFVRFVQIAGVALPVVMAADFSQLYDNLSICSDIVFLTLIVWMLFRGWRRGQGEAGVMLLPFVLAATGDLLDTIFDFAARHSWLSPKFANHRHTLGTLEFSTSTICYLLFLGSLVSVILYRFIRISQQEQRSSAEIDAARSVQAMLIPTQLPSNRSFMLESAYLPANGVGGDFFQVLPLKDDSMLIVVGDVSGKGLQAAMNASSLVGALRNELSHDPATVLEHLNQVMHGAVAGAGMSPVAGFATCLCARIYPSGEMTIANAGHLSPYRDGREMELTACLPLGILPKMEYEQSTFQLKPGDRLTFLSDGVVEAADARGELFGFERTKQVSHESARYIAQVAQRFGQTDDITVVSLYFVPA